MTDTTAPVPGRPRTSHRRTPWLAAALAADERTTYRDIAHQVEVLDLVRRLNAERARTVVAVLNDLNQAARYADHLVAMRNGRVVAQGTRRRW